MKRILTIFLSLCMIFAVGCSDVDPTDTSSHSPTPEHLATYPDSINLMYSATATFNPYEEQKSELNARLIYLMYDPLIKLNNELQPEYIIAESSVITEKSCVVTLKNVLFSDGTQVTADDVIFSYEKAKNASPKYAEQFSKVKSVSAIDASTISFVLSVSDPYFANLLDFPIIKRGTDDWLDENNLPILPIGSGQYVFDSESEALSKNTFYDIFDVKIERINLINAPDDEVINHYISTNAVSAFYADLLKLSATSSNGNVQKINSNNLIYVGFNMNKKLLKDVEMRYAISYALDRNKICSDSFYGYATAATGIYNSKFIDAKGLQNLETSQNQQLVIANLEDLGYNSKDELGYYVNDSQKLLSFELLVSNENNIHLQTAKQISSQLNSCGIKITVVEKSFDKYIEALKDGDFDLYLGEVIIPKNMDVTQIVTENGSAAFGIVSQQSNESTDTSSVENTVSSTVSSGDKIVVEDQYNLSDAIASFYDGTASLHDIINAFNSELPIVPVCHKTLTVVYDKSLIYSSKVPSYVDVFTGISTLQSK